MRQIILTALLLIVIGILLLMWESPPAIFLDKPEKSAQQQLPVADGYMLNTTTIQHDDKGNTSYTLETSEIRYFIRGGQFELDNPKILALDPDNPEQPWQLEARQGHIVRNGKKITLSDDVYAWQFVNASTRNELRSQQLVFFPDKHQATSRQRVTITTPNGETSGAGMDADLKNKLYSLVGNVKGVHSASH